MAEGDVSVKWRGLVVPLDALPEDLRRKVSARLERDRRVQAHMTEGIARSAAGRFELDAPGAKSVMTVADQKKVRELTAELRRCDASGMLGTEFSRKALDLAGQAFELAEELVGRYDATIPEIHTLVAVAWKAGRCSTAWAEFEGYRIPLDEWIKLGRPTVPLMGRRAPDHGAPFWHADVSEATQTRKDGT